MANDYGRVSYNNKDYTLVQDACFDGMMGVWIDNSIYAVPDNHVSALCVDDEGNECQAYWEVTRTDAEDGADLVDDWYTPIYVRAL